MTGGRSEPTEGFYFCVVDMMGELTFLWVDPAGGEKHDSCPDEDSVREALLQIRKARKPWTSTVVFPDY